MGIISKEQLERVDQLHKFMNDGQINDYTFQEPAQLASDAIVWAAQRAVIRDGSGTCSFNQLLEDAKRILPE